MRYFLQQSSKRSPRLLQFSQYKEVVLQCYLLLQTLPILLRPLGNSAIKWGLWLSLCAVSTVLYLAGQVCLYIVQSARNIFLIYVGQRVGVIPWNHISDISCYQRKRPDSFPAHSLIELPRLNSSALPQLMHETTKDLRKLQTQPSSAGLPFCNF